MKKRIISFIITLLIIIGGVVGYNLYRSNQPTNSPTNNQTNDASKSTNSSGSVDKKGKTLIVYFSRKDGVYGGHLRVGNTKRIADFIQQTTGGDEYEIVPAKEYPKGYQKTTEVAQQEQDDNARPKIKNKLPAVNGYDNIFIGAPIWWSEYPMIVRTFLDGVDLNNKNVIPFTTHEGSGLGNTKETLRNQYPNAKVLDGFSVNGTDAKNAKSDVNDWLDNLGY